MVNRYYIFAASIFRQVGGGSTLILQDNRPYLFSNLHYGVTSQCVVKLIIITVITSNVAQVILGLFLHFQITAYTSS